MSARPLDRRAANAEPAALRWALTALALAFLALFLLVPLGLVFAQALAAGLPAFLAAIALPDTIAAIELSLLVAAIAVPLNAAFGLCLGCEMYVLIRRIRPRQQGAAPPEPDKEVAA